MAESSRTYDIVIFGASGYTGKYVFEEVLKHPHVKCAVAGRNRTKLESVIKDLVSDDYESDVGIVIANVDDFESLLNMCKATEVLINCVGPYRFYGKQVIDACIEGRTHYLDVCGEPQFLEESQYLKFNDAKERGLYMVGACGLDSLPCDIGVQLIKENFPGDPCYVETYWYLDNKKGFSGNFATWQSAIHGVAHDYELMDIRKKLNNTLYEGFKKRKMLVPIKNRPILFKKDNSWCIPFVGSDKSVSLRSQRFNNVYKQESPVEVKTYIMMPSIFHAIGAIFLGLLFFLFTSSKLGCRILETFPKLFSGGVFSKNPGKEDESGKFQITFEAHGWENKSSDPQTIYPNKTCELLFDAPGPYKTTAICVVASALVILEDKDSMPEPGVLTPSCAFFKTSLISRLHSKGLKFKMPC